MKILRSSGVQLHPTSLASGRLGEDAYGFVDWLHAAGQSWWQVLPLGPPDRSRSPYKARSAFACWRGLLGDPAAGVTVGEEDDFRELQADWVLDWERLAGGRRAVRDQVRFDREWRRLRAYAADRGVRLIGDLPIYVAPGSVDHLSHPEFFQASAVAGAPPDDFAPKGQHWGNPLYDWPALQRRRYAWWTQRLRRSFELFDLVRIDHFRGFVAYWSIPAGAPDATYGAWRRGPGAAPFRAVERELGPLAVIAEDLGVITEPVHRLRDELGYPGMVILQFDFGRGGGQPHREDSVTYTGTHDQDTIVGWWRALDEATRGVVVDSLRRRGLAVEERIEWPLIGLAFASESNLAMVQAQDILGLGSEARMNVPGTASGNWGWRVSEGMLTTGLARRLRAATDEAGRLP
ncbi:MAG TPA: 4-alpha-glucanotransferase [Solirubrobacteraceae bacterium]|jgi:4-alpha-glucanotransferase|nr:4-alpha-glucanotransferase [Solirubrobacteraceae bacterium]